MNIEIKSRYTGGILFAGQYTDVRAALIAACAAHADLAGADLARADLAGADLARADLAGADLAGADLAGADLAGADLAHAYLAGAKLARADLARADLAHADLAGADLAHADLAGAKLAGAKLAGAKLRDAIVDGDGAVLILGPIGSRAAYLTVFRTDKGLRLQTGCFYGSASDFLARVTETHVGTKHERDYIGAVKCAAVVLGCEA